MKKILFSMFLFVSFMSAKAQTLFTQDFSSSSTVADYVNSTAPGNGQFTHNMNAANVSTSINNGKLRFTRTTASSNNAGSVTRTNVNGAGGGFSPEPLLIKLQTEFAVSGTGATPITTFALFQVGDQIPSSTTPAADGVIHSMFAINTTATSGNFTVAKSTNTSPGTGTDVSAEFSGTQIITWVVNNSGSAQSYPAPDGTTVSVADDTWDLWVGNTLALDDKAATSPAVSLPAFKFVLKNQTGAAIVDVDDMVITDLIAQAMPVKLTSFTGNRENDRIRLAWKTATELNSSHFSVLHSQNGSSFNQVATIKAAGNSTTGQLYSFIHNHPVTGNNYYQLVQVDLDGHLVRSPVIIVKSKSRRDDVIISSTGTNQVRLSLFADKQESVNFNVTDVAGRLIGSTRLTLGAGSNAINVPMQTKSGAVYIGTIQYINGEMQSVRFLAR